MLGKYPKNPNIKPRYQFGYHIQCLWWYHVRQISKLWNLGIQYQDLNATFTNLKLKKNINFLPKSRYLLKVGRFEKIGFKIWNNYCLNPRSPHLWPLSKSLKGFKLKLGPHPFLSFFLHLHVLCLHFVMSMFFFCILLFQGLAWTKWACGHLISRTHFFCNKIVGFCYLGCDNHFEYLTYFFVWYLEN